ncbi:helix-turn-helix domain-containing protein [Nonomuraea sp. NPDC050556]|uniref:helix-turn-helix domain-containing protein n=1 Tax=Nonomuraea sp. NPDC050556 TaxID=3364369 RepID=UPI0037B8E476
MTSRSRSLDPDLPRERFALELRDLHRQAGRPKQQTLASAMHCSHATVSGILNGHRFPSREQTEALVLTCEGDVRAWKHR